MSVLKNAGWEGKITKPVVSCAIFARNLVRPIRGEGPTIKRYFVVDVDEPDRNAAHHFKTSTGSRVALSSGSEHWVTASQAMYPPRYLGYNVVITHADIPTYPLCNNAACFSYLRSVLTTDSLFHVCFSPTFGPVYRTFNYFTQKSLLKLVDFIRNYVFKIAKRSLYLVLEFLTRLKF